MSAATGPMTQIAEDDIKALLDIATQSLDFGSGFLDNEEVDVLRRVAESVGVDPINVTPSDFAKQYQHEFQPWPAGEHDPSDGSCYRCFASARASQHLASVAVPT